MKKFAIIVTTITVLGIIMGIAACASAEIYPQVFVVNKVDYDRDVVTFEDFNGLLWECYGVEDWAVGDVAAAIMEDMGTEIIFDDAIINVRYCGFFEGWM